MAKNQNIIHGGYYPALTEKVGQRFKYSQKGTNPHTAVAGITPDAFKGLKETDTSYLDSYTITKKGLGAFNLPEMYLGAQIPIAEGVTVAHLQAFKKIVGGFDVFRKVRLTEVQKMKPNLEKFHGKANKFLLRGNYVWYSARETTGAAMASLLQGNAMLAERRR